MDSFYKKVIAIVLTACILAVALYGSYLPLRKAQMFISTLQGLQSQPVSSLEDLEGRLSAPLDYPSPIGQEELVRNMANSVLSFVQQSASVTSTDELIDFLNSYYAPIIARGKGMSFGQDLYLLGAVNEIAFAQTGESQYLLTAAQYYEEGVEDGPNRPQPLYGLFDVYRAMGNVTGTQMVASTILTNWPSDTGLAEALQQFLSTVPTSSKAAK